MRGDFGDGEFFSAGFLRHEVIADELEEGGAVADAGLKAGEIGHAFELLGEVGGLEADGVEAVADFVGEDVKELLQFLAGSGGGGKILREGVTHAAAWNHAIVRGVAQTIWKMVSAEGFRPRSIRRES
jgi:hypothetical protein